MSDVEVHIDLAGATLGSVFCAATRRDGPKRLRSNTIQNGLRTASLFARTRADADARRLSSAARPSRLRIYRRLGSGHLGPTPHATLRAASSRTSRANRPHSHGNRLPARRVGRDTAWRFTFPLDRNPAFQAPPRSGVPALIELGKLLQITERFCATKKRTTISRSFSRRDRPSAERGPRPR